MSPRSNDLVRELEHAARADDDGAFDTAFDRVLERARGEANPDAGARALADERLRGELGTVGASAASKPGMTTKVGAAGLAAALRTGARPIAARSGRWVRYGRGLGLVAIGVAIGFVWGRAPEWWPNDGGTEPTANEVSESVQGVLLDPTPPESSSFESTLSPVGTAAAPTEKVASSKPKAAVAGASRENPNGVQEARAPSAGGESLRFVLEQLRKAQLFLRAGEPARAIAALDLLDQRVPAPVLSEERDVTRTLALCDSGETAKAAALAARVLERAPESAYAVSLRESCAGKAALLEQMRERTSNPVR